MDDKDITEWTESERQELMELARERGHRKWLGEILLRWAKWAAAVSIGVTVVWDAASKLVARLSGH